MEYIAGLELVEPARAGNEFRYGVRLLLLQVAVALHDLFFGVVKGHVETLTPPIFYPYDQHFLQMDHHGGLARQHPGGSTSWPALKAAVIFSLSFLTVCNTLSRRSSVLRMSAVYAPLLYLLRISIFCSMVMDFLDFFLPEASFSLRSRFGAMMHKKKKKKKHCTNTNEDDRENTNNVAYMSTRGHVYVVVAQREKDAAQQTQALRLLSPLPPPTASR